MTYTKEGKDMGRIVKILDEHKRIFEKYLPTYGQGITMATQTVTAILSVAFLYHRVNLMPYTCDNCGKQADEANWLYRYGDDTTQYIMDRIKDCKKPSDFEDILEELAEHVFDADDLAALDRVASRGDVFDCDGRFYNMSLASKL